MYFIAIRTWVFKFDFFFPEGAKLKSNLLSYDSILENIKVPQIEVVIFTCDVISEFAY